MRTINIIIILLMLIVTTVIFAETRRERDEEFLKKTINIEENQTLINTIKVCDPDGDPVVIDVEDLPMGAVVSNTYEFSIAPDPNECVGDPNCIECFADPNSSWYGADITWTPTYGQSGQYKLYIHAMDDQGGDDWVIYIINVADKNRPPVL